MEESLSSPVEKRAYQFSKWTKKLLLDSAQEYAAKKDMPILLEALCALKKQPADRLKSILLKKIKQVHISASGNKTPLYTLNLRALATLNIAHNPKAKKMPIKEEKWLCSYLESSKTDDTSSEQVVIAGLLKGSWFYPAGMGKRKSIQTAGFEKLQPLGDKEYAFYLPPAQDSAMAAKRKSILTCGKFSTPCAEAFAAECSLVSKSPRIYLTAALHLLFRGVFTIRQIIGVYHKYSAEETLSAARLEQYFKQLQAAPEFSHGCEEFRAIEMI